MVAANSVVSVLNAKSADNTQTGKESEKISLNPPFVKQEASVREVLSVLVPSEFHGARDCPAHALDSSQCRSENSGS